MTWAVERRWGSLTLSLRSGLGEGKVAEEGVQVAVEEAEGWSGKAREVGDKGVSWGRRMGEAPEGVGWDMLGEV